MKYIFYILLISLLFSKCITEVPPDPERETYYLDQEMYDYVIFPKGSWWVYEEGNGGIRDSVAIMSKNTELIEHSRFVDYDYEVCNTKIFSSYYGNRRGQSSALFKGTGVCDYFEIYSDHPSSPTTYKYISIKLLNDTISFTTNRKLAKRDIIDSLKVHGNNYYDVIIFDQLDGDLQVINSFYYAKGVGLIIEEDVENNQTWNLIKHHINN